MTKTDFVQITRGDKFSEEEFYPMVNRMYEQIWGNLLPPQLVTNGLSNTIKNNVVTPPDAPVPDCLTCGACCQALLCVGVRPSDEVAPELYWDINSKGENSEIVVDRYLRRNGETLACAALGGTIGEQVACTIYETRPKMCHHFDAGSDRCHAIRRAYGIEAFLTLAEMSEAMGKLDAVPATAERTQIIRNAQIKEEPGTGKLTIVALMNDGRMQTIHTYDPKFETWMQFEFDGLRMTHARDLIDSRRRSSDGAA